MAAHLLREVVKPMVAGADRLTFALDDTPTERYGRKVRGAGVHHNPTPGPAGGPFAYGHVWVVTDATRAPTLREWSGPVNNNPFPKFEAGRHVHAAVLPGDPVQEAPARASTPTAIHCRPLRG